ncbi:hypothetical protein LQ948_16170 [Jiella sp. MQZ9-1]|uniref:Mor transcription activator family protein n=1 Tax=Jiella flava TaxID=2816857 RepID=A0A939G0L0_9HYPH|nr:hypothetical protein [Jiella flava]MBO0664171.1 hypothetical protein [Jiella flava]MCD2472743.1 hypothetical protein [Jiella flava]
MSERLEDELLALLGPADFVRLVEAFGGERRYVPKRDDDTEIAQHLGPAAARKLASAFGGDTIAIPLARGYRAAHYRAAALNNRQIAKRLGISLNGVEKIFRRTAQRAAQRTAKPKPSRPPASQRGLFDPGSC